MAIQWFPGKCLGCKFTIIFIVFDLSKYAGRVSIEKTPMKLGVSHIKISKSNVVNCPSDMFNLLLVWGLTTIVYSPSFQLMYHTMLTQSIARVWVELL